MKFRRIVLISSLLVAIAGSIYLLNDVFYQGTPPDVLANGLGLAYVCGLGGIGGGIIGAVVGVIIGWIVKSREKS
ncbi:MAG: hypothetical protein ACK2T7_03985 [Anaerolineales bacterium]